MWLRNVVFLTVVMFTMEVPAAEKPIHVWPGKVPGEKGDIGQETATPS